MHDGRGAHFRTDGTSASSFAAPGGSTSRRKSREQALLPQCLHSQKGIFSLFWVVLSSFSSSSCGDGEGRARRWAPEGFSHVISTEPQVVPMRYAKCCSRTEFRLSCLESRLLVARVHDKSQIVDSSVSPLRRRTNVDLAPKMLHKYWCTEYVAK